MNQESVTQEKRNAPKDDQITEQATAKKERPVFLGFNPSFKGYSQLPNEWLDEIISQIDNAAELKIVLYVYRHTWGYQEKKINPDDPTKHDEIKHITTDEFMHGRKKRDGTRMDKGTGLSKHSVIDGLRNAIKHGYVLEEVDDTDKGRVVKSYALKMLKTDENSCADSAPQECNSFTPDVNNLHSSGEESSHRTEKETSEKKKKKERKKESSLPLAHSSIHSSSLSDDSLDKVREYAEEYRYDASKCQQRAQEIYQQYDVSDDDFYRYLLEAYKLDKSKDMVGVITQLQLLLVRTKQDSMKTRHLVLYFFVRWAVDDGFSFWTRCLTACRFEPCHLSKGRCGGIGRHAYIHDRSLSVSQELY